MERRLAAVLAADVVGYSRLMGTDEAGTLDALTKVRGEFIDSKIAEHQGRTVKVSGDGLLLEFPSVVNAVRCAAEIQRGMRDRNTNVPQERRIEFRIGDHRGARLSARVLPRSLRHKAQVHPPPPPDRAVPDELPAAGARLEGDSRQPGCGQYVPLLD